MIFSSSFIFLNNLLMHIIFKVLFVNLFINYNCYQSHNIYHH